MDFETDWLYDEFHNTPDIGTALIQGWDEEKGSGSWKVSQVHTYQEHLQGYLSWLGRR